MEQSALKEAAISSSTFLCAMQKSPELVSIMESCFSLTFLTESFS